MIDSMLHNHSLVTALTAWLLAQTLKPFLEYLRTGNWNLYIIFSSGGMPSSHSALMVGATMGVALHDGVATPIFTVALAMTMIVLYDAAGVRREAGKHAEKINILIDELLSGHPISEKELREVIGHTPLEVLGGIILGVIVSISYWYWIG